MSAVSMNLDPMVGLEVEQVSIAFGGHKAVDGVTLSAHGGSITGLIGPNGAGKTTLFNACSGLLRPLRGSIRLFGIDVTRKSPAARARIGLGRSFQRMELVNAMTVWRNVALGAECRMVGSNPFSQILSTGAQSRAIREATNAALELCMITDLADRPVGALSIGQRRLVEVARLLAGGFPLLLLDEPSSGLDDEESDAFGELLVAVVAEHGLGILLVEHDMKLVMSVCQQLYVLEFGRLIFVGTPEETQASELVRSAYLGTQPLQVTT